MCELVHVLVHSGCACVSMYICVRVQGLSSLWSPCHHWPSAAHHCCWGLPRLSVRPLRTGSLRSLPPLEVWVCEPSSAPKASRVVWRLASSGIQSCESDPAPQGAHKPLSLLVSWKPATPMRNTLLFYLRNTKGFLHAGSSQAFENKVSVRLSSQGLRLSFCVSVCACMPTRGASPRHVKPLVTPP